MQYCCFASIGQSQTHKIILWSSRWIFSTTYNLTTLQNKMTRKDMINPILMVLLQIYVFHWAQNRLHSLMASFLTRITESILAVILVTFRYRIHVSHWDIDYRVNAAVSVKFDSGKLISQSKLLSLLTKSTQSVIQYCTGTWKLFMSVLTIKINFCCL